MLTKHRLFIFSLPLEKMCLESSLCYLYEASWALEGLGMGCPAPRKELGTISNSNEAHQLHSHSNHRAARECRVEFLLPEIYLTGNSKISKSVIIASMRD